MLQAGTFSIAAYDAVAGACGAAISSRMPAVGSLCVFARSDRGAIATQAWINPLLAVDGLGLLETRPANDTLRTLIDSDPDSQLRQVLIVDRAGESAAHTCRHTHPWSGHRTGPGYAAAGNILIGEETIDAMVEKYQGTTNAPLQERLLAALEAGQAAGGDSRGRQSAALYVSRGHPYPYLDLRVDDHPDPVAELRRTYEVARRELLPFVEAMPTRENPRGRFSQLLGAPVARLE